MQSTVISCGGSSAYKVIHHMVLGAIERDDAAELADCPIEYLVKWHRAPNFSLELPPPLAYAVKLNSVVCVAYLLTVPDLDVNVDAFIEFDNMIAKLTPWAIAITWLAKKGKIESARLLARDPRVDVNMNVRVDGWTVPAVIRVDEKANKKLLPDNGLLIHLIRNPSFNLNRVLAVPAYSESTGSLVDVGDTEQTYFMFFMTNAKKDVFYEMLKDPDVDLTYRCSRFGRNVLHYAMERNLRFAVVKLLEVMSAEDINRPDKSGVRPYKVEPHNNSQYPQLVKLFVKCRKFELEDTMLGDFIRVATVYHSNTAIERQMPALVASLKSASIELIDAVLVSDKFDMPAAVRSANSPFIAAIAWPDETMMVKLRTWDKFVDRHLRGEADADDRLVDAILLAVLSRARQPNGIAVLKEAMKIAVIRDEIMKSVPDRGVTSLQLAVIDDRDDILRVLLDSITEVVPVKQLRRFKKPKCDKVLSNIVRTSNKKATVVERGHVFDCC